MASLPKRDSNISLSTSDNDSTIDEQRAVELLTKATQNETHILHQVLLEGAVFLKYGKRGQPKWKTVHCDTTGDGMKLTWADLPVDQNKPAPAPSGSIRLSDITMLLTGKFSNVFKRSVAKNAPDWLCFSVVTSKRTLDLQAHSGNQRDLWVKAITEMVKSIRQNQAAAKRAKDESMNKFPKSPSISTLPDPENPNSVESEDTIIMKELSEGATLTKHGRFGAPKPKHVFVQRGKLFWCKPSVAPSSATSFIQLNQVEVTLPGKKTDVFSRKVARKVPGSLCFSVVTKEKTLDLQCKDRAERDRWLRNLRFIIQQAQQKEDLLATILSNRLSGGADDIDVSVSEADDQSTTKPFPDVAKSSSTDIFVDDDEHGPVAAPASSEEDEDDDPPPPPKGAAPPSGRRSSSPVPPPPPPPNMDDPEAMAAFEQAQREHEAQEQEAQQALQKSKKGKGKERKKSKRALGSDRKKKSRKKSRKSKEAKEKEAARRAEVEKSMEKEVQKLAKTAEEAKAQELAVQQQKLNTQRQENALAEAQAQVQKLEDALKKAQMKSAMKQKTLDAQEKKIHVIVEDKSHEYDAKGTNTTPAAGGSPDAADDESVMSSSSDPTLDSILRTDTKKKKKKRRLQWRDDIAEIREVEKIIILAPDYGGLDGDGNDLSSDEDDDSESDHSPDEHSLEDVDDDDEEEEEKARSFLPINNTKKFLRDLGRHRAVIQSTARDWNSRLKAMSEISKMCRDRDLTALKSKLWSEMEQLKRCLAVQVEDLRSQVVKEACNLLITLTDVLGHKEEWTINVVKPMLPILFRRLYVTIKVIAVSADECVRAVLTRAYFWSFKTIPEILKAASTDSHSVVRAKAVQYLTQILNECPDDQFSSVFVYEKRLASLIKKNIGDSDRKVRSSTRQLFLAFANVWPQLAHKLYDKFNKTTQKTITAELRKMMENS